MASLEKTNGMKPNVSVNLCCYFAEKYLREALDSVASQTYRDWEFIIINDGSKDATDAIIKEYIDRGLPIVYHYQENHGLGYSRNEALKRSSGKYIAFIDQDDAWLPEKLERQAALFEKTPLLDFIYTNYYVVRGDRAEIKFSRVQPEGDVFERFLLSYPVHVSSAMVSRKALDRLGSLFNPNLNLTEEYDLFMRVLYRGKAGYIAEPVATYRHHSAMTSATRELKLIQETISVVDSFKRIDPRFEGKYADTLRAVDRTHQYALAFYRAKDKLAQGESVEAREIISSYKLYSAKTFVFFLFTFFPSSVSDWAWQLALKIKSSRLTSIHTVLFKTAKNSFLPKSVG